MITATIQSTAAVTASVATTAAASAEAQGQTINVGGKRYTIGSGLKLTGDELSVDTATAVEQDNTLPVTSAAVYTELGNVEALLKLL